MSRIGRAPIVVPKDVKLNISGNTVTVEGPKGKLSQEIHEQLEVVQEGNEIIVNRPSDDKFVRSIHGTIRALIANMIIGVTDGFSKTLQIVGVGYRVEQQGKNLNLILGFSHPVVYKAPEGIDLKAETQTKIVISGIDKQSVGQVAAEIRNYRRPEPYKGKGISYEGEIIRRKQGKRTGK